MSHCIPSILGDGFTSRAMRARSGPSVIIFTRKKKKRVEPVELHGIFAILPIPRACPSPVAYMTGDMCEGSSLVRKNSYGGPFVHYLGTQFVGQRQVMGLAVHFPEWAQGPIRRSPSPWLPRTNFLGENVYRMPPCKEIEVTKD